MKNPNLKIIYNPFTVKTIFLLNGEASNTLELDNLAKGKRLQQWIDRLFNPQLFKNLNTDELDFVFDGTELGFGDVQDAVNAFITEYGSRYKLNADYIVHKVEADKKIKQLKDLFDEAQSSPFDEFRSSEMHRAFEKTLEPEFDVTVLATMSAGKSTVINAIVGRELLPSKNEACTATLARVINEDSSMQEFQVRRLGETGDVIDDWQNVTDEEQLELVGKWNEETTVTSIIELKGNIPAIYVREGIQMVLVDTPGPNNSNDPSHRSATVKAIKSNQPSMVLYILNATQLGVDDDNSLLKLIKEAMEKGGREAHDRFIFIANKIDMLDSAKETVESVIQNVKKYLQSNGIVSPIVIPVSAELAKLIRIKRFHGEDALTKKQKRTLRNLVEQFVDEEDMNLLERARDDLPRSIYQNLKKQVDEAKAQNDDERVAELLSGIPIIEAILDTYLMKHAVPSRIKDAVQVFNTITQENDIRKKLNSVLSMSEAELKSAASVLDDFNASERRIEQARAFEQKVKELKYTQSSEVKAQRISIDKKVNALLDELSGDFKEKLAPSRADTIMSNADQKARSLIAEIQEILTESLPKAIDEEARVLKAEYSNYVEDLLGNFPSSKNMDVVKAFQTSSLEMPDVKSLIQKATFEEQEIKVIGTERHGFLWLSKRNVYKTISEEKVDMSGVGSEFTKSLLSIRHYAWKDFEKLSNDNFEQLKKALLEQMKVLDGRLNEVVKSIKEATSNKAEKEKMLKESEDQNIWYNSFEKRLASILEVGESK